jgi:hypothetical protein
MHVAHRRLVQIAGENIVAWTIPTDSFNVVENDLRVAVLNTSNAVLFLSEPFTVRPGAPHAIRPHPLVHATFATFPQTPILPGWP